MGEACGCWLFEPGTKYSGGHSNSWLQTSPSSSSNQISILASQTGLLAVWYPYSDPTRLDFIVISYGFEASVTEFLAMRLSTAAFIALAVRTAGLRVILDTDLGDDIDDTWALSALLQAQQREEGCYCCSWWWWMNEWIMSSWIWYVNVQMFSAFETSSCLIIRQGRYWSHLGQS